MALAYDTKNNVAGSNTITVPLTIDPTCKLIVIGIAAALNTANRNGTPTWNTTENFTKIGNTITGYKECQAEMWYLSSPVKTGAANVVVPNTGKAALNVIASAYKGATACELDQSTSQNAGGGTAADPSLTLNNVPDGSAVVDILADGNTSIPSANSHTLLYAIDGTAWIDAGQYTISPHDADIDDEDMADISDWTDGDTGTSESTQVTFDSKSCMKLDSTGGQARRSQDIGSFGNRTVFSMSLYHDEIHSQGEHAEGFIFSTSNGSVALTIKWCSDGLFVFDGSSYNEVGTDLVVQDTWQEWKFDVNWVAQTVDVYLNGILKASGVDCSYIGGGTAGEIIFMHLKYTDGQLSYIDWFKAGSVKSGDTSNITLSYTITADDVAMIMASFKESAPPPAWVCGGKVKNII